MRAFPMGPTLEKWMTPIKNENFEPAPEQLTAFAAEVLKKIADNPISDRVKLANLADELVAMGFYKETLALIDANSELWVETDLQMGMTEGIASFIAGDYQRSLDAYTLIQELYPDEPAPYVNIALILVDCERGNEAIAWLEACIDRHPNHLPAWQAVYLVIEDQELSSGIIGQLWRKANSWLGATLELETIPEATSLDKANILKTFYDQGERSDDFLVEYTGVLGILGEFESIPAMIWEVESRGTPSWKLILHKLQAHLAADQVEEFNAQALKWRYLFPENILGEIDQWRSDLPHN